jgi:hypothetical protein
VSSVTTVCNAAIHKYLFVADLVGQNLLKIPQIYLNLLMFFLQIAWPLIAVLFLLNMDLHPAEVLEDNKKVGIKMFILACLVCQATQKDALNQGSHVKF